MHRIVIRITDELLAGIGEAMKIDNTEGVFGDKKFALITFLSNTEIKLTLMTEDEIFEEVKNDSNVQILM